jgi:anti-sigma B factor antagonist
VVVTFASMDESGHFPLAQLGDDVCLIAARGEIDGSTVWRLQDAFGAASDTGARRLIADLAAVTYLDADVLAALSASAARIHREGGRLVIVTDDPWIVRLLGASDLDGVAEIEPTLRDVVGVSLLRAAE